MAALLTSTLRSPNSLCRKSLRARMLCRSVMSSWWKRGLRPSACSCYMAARPHALSRAVSTMSLWGTADTSHTRWQNEALDGPGDQGQAGGGQAWCAGPFGVELTRLETHKVAWRGTGRPVTVQKAKNCVLGSSEVTS